MNALFFVEAQPCPGTGVPRISQVQIRAIDARHMLNMGHRSKGMCTGVCSAFVELIYSFDFHYGYMRYQIHAVVI